MSNSTWPDTRPVWQCFIPGQPVARAEKIIKIKGRLGIGDKDAQKDYKAYVKAYVAQYAPRKVFSVPLFLQVQVYRDKPKSTPKRDIYPTAKPDISNYVKLLEDCLTGIVIRDDALIVAQINQKYFASKTQPAGVWLVLSVDLETYQALKEVKTKK
jgi:Holliday junction resolvase RusA-like endonuclease